MRISDWSSDVCSSDLKAEALDPRSAQTQSMLGLLYERIGRPALAEPYYEKSAKLAPRDGATLNNYAIWLSRSKPSEESLSWFNRALVDPFYQTRAKIGRAHVRTRVTTAHIVCRLLLAKQQLRSYRSRKFAAHHTLL